MKKKLITLMAVLMAAGAGYSALLLSSDFTTDTVGARPLSLGTGANAVYTGTAYPNYVFVVGSASNTAGTGNAMHFVDQSASATKADFNFSATVSAVRVDFSLSALSTSGIISNYMTIGLTGGVTYNGNTDTNRYNSLRLYDNGKIRFNVPVGPVDKTTTLGASTAISIFVNDGSSAITYLALDGSGYKTLAADSVAYWMNNQFVVAGTLQGPSSATTAGLGALSFSSTSVNTGIDYVFDNVSVQSIPEPATIGMVMLGALAIFGVRRYKG